MIRDIRPWAILFVAPLFINILLWQAVIRPEQSRLRQRSEISRMEELKPRFETVLTESQVLLSGEKQTGFEKRDVSQTLDELQRWARQYHVEIKNSKIKESGPSGAELNVNVTGNFDRIAQWVSEIEKSPRLQLSTWTLTAAEELNRPHQLNADISIEGVSQ